MRPIKYVDTVQRNKHYRCLEYDHEQEGDLYLIACGMEQCDGGVTTGPDVRDGYHLHVVLSGTGELHAGGTVVRPRFGQMFLLKHNEEAWYAADRLSPWKYCWVTYNGTAAKALSEQLGFTKGVYCVDMKGGGEVFYDLVSRMQQHPEMNESGNLMRRGILLEFLALALDARDAGRKKPCPMRSDVGDYVDKAIQFIQYNYATINVGDIIAYIGFTRSYFSTQFKRVTGLSLQEYLIQHRIRTGQELLTYTDLDVGYIAGKVGYENALSFSREFHKRCGCSPSDYRQRHLTERES